LKLPALTVVREAQRDLGPVVYTLKPKCSWEVRPSVPFDDETAMLYVC